MGKGRDQLYVFFFLCCFATPGLGTVSFFLRVVVMAFVSTEDGGCSNLMWKLGFLGGAACV